MECESETVTLNVQYFVDAEIDGVSGAQAFGPVYCKSDGVVLLNTIAARSNVKKATLRKETVS